MAPPPKNYNDNNNNIIMVANMEEDKVADTVADKVGNMVAKMVADKVADMVAGQGCWLIGPKLFRPETYPTCVSSKLCEFITYLSAANEVNRVARLNRYQEHTRMSRRLVGRLDRLD